MAIEEQAVAGASLEFFVIYFAKGKMTVRVPTRKATNVGLRKPSANHSGHPACRNVVVVVLGITHYSRQYSLVLLVDTAYSGMRANVWWIMPLGESPKLSELQIVGQ